MNSDHNDNLPSLTILGVYIKSDAYPNVKYKVEGLLQAKLLSVREINFPPECFQRIGDTPSLIGLIKSLWSAVRFGYAHLRAIMAVVSLNQPRNLYIPYPAVFLLYLLSFLPARWRPDKICADAFISLYDTIVKDRKLIAPENPLARLLYAIEKRAYQNADLVLVDTKINASYLSGLFRIPVDRVMALPLSINEVIYAPSPYMPDPNGCTVLFIGTFVPLQGVDVIARAIVLLQLQQRVHCRLIGNGQTARAVASILESADCTNYTWERHWQSAANLAMEIQRSDICLGIFGDGEKSQRVWPLKNYAYMATGRTIVTADTCVAREILNDSGEDSFKTVAPGHPEELAQAIIDLANNPKQRSYYAEASRRYYERHLSNTVSLNRLLQALSQ